jgi:hypothetical protein
VGHVAGQDDRTLAWRRSAKLAADENLPIQARRASFEVAQFLLLAQELVLH